MTTVSATDAGTVRLAGRAVPRLGFGAMRLPGPGVWGPPADRDTAIAVCRRAVELGVRVIDTAWYYGTPDRDVANEILAAALRPYPEDLVFVTKLGGRRTDDAGWAAALRPDQLRAGCERDLRVLGLECVPVAHLRWLDEGGPDGVPFADALGTMLELRDEGKIGAIGLSNVDVEQIRTAGRVTDVATVSNPYSPLQRDDEPVVEHCDAAGIPYLPFFPLAIGAGGRPRGGRRGRRRGGRDAGPGRARVAAAPLGVDAPDPRHRRPGAPRGERRGGLAAPARRDPRPPGRRRPAGRRLGHPYPSVARRVRSVGGAALAGTPRGRRVRGIGRDMANKRRRVASTLVGLVAAGMISTAGVAAADGPVDVTDPGSSLGDVIGGMIDQITGLFGGDGSLPEIPEVPLPNPGDLTSSSTPPPSSTTPSTQTETRTVYVPPAVYGPGSPYYHYVAPRPVNLLNCADFADRADAQAVLVADPSDPNNLDADHDGRACDLGVGHANYTGYPVGGVATGDGSDRGPTIGEMIFLAIAGIGAGAGVVRGRQVVAARRETV